MLPRNEVEDRLVGAVASFSKDPLGFVKFAFQWGEGELQSSSGPREWQAEILDEIGKRLRDDSTRFHPIRIGVASGHGVGKSQLISTIIGWAMSTCPDTKIIVTANTDTQLRSKTWPEVSKWMRLLINKHWFTLTATAVHASDKTHEKTWRADSIPWTEHNPESFAGMHNKGRRIVVIFDEASAISDKIWEVTEGALTDEDTEIIWLAFGNPTRNTGRFKECFGRFKHRWITKQIDSRTVDGTNKEQIQKWIDDYGLTSDFVKIRVLGLFPSASAKQFISTTDVDAAYGKHLKEHQYNWAPKIMTVDPAWEGDDEFVIGLRQGLYFRILHVSQKNDNDVFMANLIARLEDEHKADAVFIDGGYGTGIVSVGRTIGRSWQLVWFAEKAHDEGCLNKRAEIWKSARDWLKEGGAIPPDPVLHADLIGPETVARLDGKIQLEAKKDMKARGIKSPGRGDCLALSFSYPVSSKHTAGLHHKLLSEFDPASVM